MKLMTRYFMILTLLAVCATASADQGENWRPLFDGKTLDGWTQRNGKALYTVADGAIVGQTVLGEPNSSLCTDKDYANFILEVEFKVDEGLNSGIQIRSESKADYRNGRVHGYQVEINPANGGARSGGVYDEARRAWLVLSDGEAVRKVFKPGDWNRFRIEAIGPSIRTWINGVLVSDLVDSMTPSGFIALQVHGTKSEKPMRVSWRDIRIQDLGQSGGITRSILGESANTMGAAAPKGAVVLLNKKSGLGKWQIEGKPEKEIGWKLDDDGVLEILPGDGQLVTKRNVRDFHLHLEFNVNEGSGNSGVYIQRRYEVQILNSADSKELRPGDCGGLYKTTGPRVNAARPAGQWQVYDIVFRAPRWNGAGEKLENARLTVVHNGVLIHDNTDVPNKTGVGLPEGVGGGPIRLQDHGNPVKFRNIWLVDLKTELKAIPHVGDYTFGQSSKALRAVERGIRGAKPAQLKWTESWVLALLESPETTREGKQFACRMLEMVGTKASLDALERLLTDEEISHMARFALEGMPFEEVDAILLRALDKTKGDLRIGVISSIAARGDEGAAEALGKIAKGKREAEATAAIKALGKIGGAEAYKALMNVSTQHVHNNLCAYCDANLAVLDTLLIEKDSLGTARYYGEIAIAKVNPMPIRVAAWLGRIRASRERMPNSIPAKDESLHDKEIDRQTAQGEKGALAEKKARLRETVRKKRKELEIGLSTWNFKSPADLIIEMLRSDELDLQWAGAMFLPEAPGEEATKKFAAVCDEMKPAGRVALLTALGNRGDKLAAPAAAQALECDDESVRVAALNALAVLGGKDNVRAIAQAAAAGGATGKAAEACLARLCDKGVGLAFKNGVANADWDVKTRVALIEGMVSRGQTHGVEALIKVAEDDNAKIRSASLKALGALAGDKNFAALVALLAKAEKPADAKAREKAVAATANRVENADKAAQTLLDTRKKAVAAPPEVRAALTRLLGRVGGAQALEAALASSKEEDKAIREAAIRALADWPDSSPAERLLEIARSTQDEILHVLALRGYVRMAADKREMLEAAAKTARRDEEKKLIRDALAKVK